MAMKPMLLEMSGGTSVVTDCMRNYSFILTSRTGSEQLCRLGQFPDSKHAVCLAEHIAAELSIAGNWSGWTIEVRDCEGSPVLSIPLGAGHGDGSLMTNGALEIAGTPQAA